MVVSLHLQPRDLLLLEELGEYGLLDTATIYARHWSGAKDARACQQRLSKLAEAGLIRQKRLIVSLDSGHAGGSLPATYTLTPRGADFIERETGRRPLRIANKELAESTVFHRLETVQARLAIDDACDAAGLQRPKWILEQDSYENVSPTDPLERRQKLFERIMLEDGSEVSCRPDASSLLYIPKLSRPDTFDPLVIYWEIDRNARNKSSSTREAEKVPGYEALVRSGGHEEHWPQAKSANVRVFYVCAIAQDFRTPTGRTFTPLLPGRDRLRTDLGTGSRASDAAARDCKTFRRT